jgi:hypothetical protein
MKHVWRHVFELIDPTLEFDLCAHSPLKLGDLYSAHHFNESNNGPFIMLIHMLLVHFYPIDCVTIY